MDHQRIKAIMSGRQTGLGSTLLRCMLTPAGWVYGSAALLRRRAYRRRLRGRHRAAAPVISVGNITAGGTGKTPMVAWLVQQLAVVKADPDVYFVPTPHVGFKIGRGAGLHYHFGTRGQLQHGHAYVQHYLKSMGQSLKTTDRRFAPADLPKGKKVKIFILGGQRNMEGEEAYVSQIADFSKFETLDRDQKDVLYQYSLGGGVSQSLNWEPLGPTGYLSNFGPELSFGRAVKKTLKKNLKKNLPFHYLKQIIAKTAF